MNIARELRPILSVAAFAAATSGALAQGTPAPANDPAAAPLIATEIRHQGFRCDDPHSAVRDEAASQPDITVWIITCDNATYRVRLIPDMGAQIEPLS